VKFRICAAVGALLVFSGGASAEVLPAGSWYAAVRVGGVYMQNTLVAGLNLNASPLFPAPTNVVSHKPGWIVSAAGGYQVGDSARLELEIGESRTAVRRAFGNPTTVPGLGLCAITVPDCASVGETGGATRVESYMANGYYDFPTSWLVTPFIGVGLGLANIHEERVGQPRGVLLQGSTGAFAYAAMGGFSFAVAPRVAIDVAYRYFGTTSQHFLPNRFGTPRADVQSHALTAGVRYRFL
jgi:opacity protein-like surface antigen